MIFGYRLKTDVEGEKQTETIERVERPVAVNVHIKGN